MTELPETSRAVVYDPDSGSLDVRSFPLRPPRSGEILVGVSLSAICGSDLHTISGRRRPRGPLVLGHEICGRVARLGEGVTRDSAGKPLSAGDRITWSIAANCGACFFCTHGIPQKCESLFKYGHESIDVDPPLNSGFAEHVYLAPGTAVFRVPDEIDDDTVVFANCSLATMAAAMRMTDMQPGESVLIQGAGLVGVCATALAAARGAETVMVVDPDADRLSRAERFGATHTFRPTDDAGDAFDQAVDEVLRHQREAGGGPARGFDVAIEVCGQPGVIPIGIESLRIGGRYVVAGCVFPDAVVELDMYAVITRLIQIVGLHNYTPADLETALDFLAGPGRAYPFNEVVESHYRLDEIDEALREVGRRTDILRVALAP